MHSKFNLFRLIIATLIVFQTTVTTALAAPSGGGVEKAKDLLGELLTYVGDEQCIDTDVNLREVESMALPSIQKTIIANFWNKHAKQFEEWNKNEIPGLVMTGQASFVEQAMNSDIIYSELVDGSGTSMLFKRFIKKDTQWKAKRAQLRKILSEEGCENYYSGYEDNSSDEYGAALFIYTCPSKQSYKLLSVALRYCNA